jgi:hypothetical protein
LTRWLKGVAGDPAKHPSLLALLPLLAMMIAVGQRNSPRPSGIGNRNRQISDDTEVDEAERQG